MTPPARESYRAIVAQARTSGTHELPGRQPSLTVKLSAFRLGRTVAPGRGSGIPLALGPQNAAPLLVLGYRHPALDADVHPLARFGIA